MDTPRGPSAIVTLPKDIAGLGPLSIGHPHEGYLLNSVKMPTSPRWVLTVPSHGFGTQETVDQLQHCIDAVHEQFPRSMPVMLGSISAEYGGLLPPHQSHRSGRDADVYFFRKAEAQWSRAATKEDIDLPRTWAMLRCFITDTDVDMILIVRRVQDWIEEYALSQGEPAGWIHSLFHDKGSYKTAVVRDVPGHVAHMHVRFTSPTARRRAVKVYDRLVRVGAVVPAQQQRTHTVVRGDTLSQLAERYETSVAKIQKMNALTGTVIKVGQRLVLSEAIDLRDARAPVIVPPRRRPPTLVASSDNTEGNKPPKRTPQPKPVKGKANATVSNKARRESPLKDPWAARPGQ